MQPFLTRLKRYLSEDIHLFIQLTTQICTCILVFGILCVFAAWLLGIPVLELIYGIQLPGCLVPLLLIIIGGTFNTLTSTLSTALITMQHTLGQFVAYLATAIFALVISNILVERSGLLGAAMSYLICMVVLFICYVILFTVCIRKNRHSRKRR